MSQQARHRLYHALAFVAAMTITFLWAANAASQAEKPKHVVACDR